MYSDGTPQALRRLRRAGETCLWLLVIGATVVALMWLASQVLVVVVPLGLAIVLTTVLQPPAGFLKRRGAPNALAAFLVVGGALLLFAGVIVGLAPTATAEFDELDVSISEGLGTIQDWLVDGPLALSAEQVDDVVGEARRMVEDRAADLGQRVLTGAFVVLELLAALLLTIVMTFFLVKDGTRIWTWICSLAPLEHREDVRTAGERSWGALGGFVRAQAMVAAFDAVFIGLSLLVLGVPLVLPLAVLTFFGAFLPIVGAVLAGAAAALVALVSDGVGTAMLVVVAILIVQQLEGNVLQPVLVGRSVRVHPLAVLIAVSAGIALAGLIGGLVAAPLLAAGAAVLKFVRERADDAERDAGRLRTDAGAVALGRDDDP